MATYDIAGHALLSDGALRLEAVALEAHVRVAEQVLGLAGSSLAGDEAEAARDAIALQVSYQVDEMPDRAWGSLVKDGRLEWLTDNTGVSPVALRMAARLVGTGRRRPVASVKVPTVADEDKPFAFTIT